MKMLLKLPLVKFIVNCTHKHAINSTNHQKTKGFQVVSGERELN